MPRKKIYRTELHPYHITARTVNKEFWPLPMEEVWSIFNNYLWFIQKSFKVQVHAFVLMSNHYHLVLQTPEANLDEAMNYFAREVSKAINRAAGTVNQVFGGPYHWSVIRNSIHYHHVYKYVYRNPVHAGICGVVQAYEYSTLRGLLGKARLLLPVADNMCLIQNPYSQLEWLNTEYQDEDYKAIRKGLTHREFCFPKDKNTGSPHILEMKVV